MEVLKGTTAVSRAFRLEPCLVLLPPVLQHRCATRWHCALPAQGFHSQKAAEPRCTWAVCRNFKQLPQAELKQMDSLQTLSTQICNSASKRRSDKHCWMTRLFHCCPQATVIFQRVVSEAAGQGKTFSQLGFSFILLQQ